MNLNDQCHVHKIPPLFPIHMYSAFIDKVERNCHFPAGTAWLTAKRYSVSQIRIKYRSISTVKATCLYCSSSCRGAWKLQWRSTLSVVKYTSHNLTSSSSVRLDLPKVDLGCKPNGCRDIQKVFRSRLWNRNRLETEEKEQEEINDEIIFGLFMDALNSWE
jgi:hypothetical protein